MPRRICFILNLLLLTALTINLHAQSHKPLDHDAYEIWNRINEKAISPDGQWVLFSYGPENGDAHLQVRRTAEETRHEFPRGVSAAFSYDSRHAAFLIKPAKAAVREAKLAETKAEEMPKDSLGILDLASGAVVYAGPVKSYQLPEKAGGYLAYLLEKMPKMPDSTAADSAIAPAPKSSKGDKKPATKQKTKEKPEGTTLVLRDLNGGSETRFQNVLEYRFSKDGRWLVYSASSKDSSADGMFAVETASGTATPLLTGGGDYQQAAFDDAGRQVAFLSNRDADAAEQPAYRLYYRALEKGETRMLAQESSPGIPAGWWISEQQALYFSRDGKRLFFGTAPRPGAPDTSAAEIPEDEKVVLDIWNWQDPYLQPMQLKDLEKEQKRAYLAVLHLDRQQIVQLGNQTIPEVIPGSKGDAAVALGISNLPYRQEMSWDYPDYYDAYLIDLNSGKAREVLEKVQARPELSPQARYLFWWNRQQLAWQVADTRSGTPRMLCTGISHPLQNEQHDWPYAPDPYGVAGWLEGDREVLVYDKYDIWSCDPAGKRPPRNLTKGFGRESDLRFRYVKLDPETEFIAAADPLLLSGFHRENKTAGFYQILPDGSAAPRLLLSDRKTFSDPLKAKMAERLLFTREDFREFPDLWVSSGDFSDMQRVSDVNPQQKEYRWGSSQLIEWTSLDGEQLQGILYLPQDFDSTRKYPTMVTFYEKSSYEVYKYTPPGPHRSVISPSFYASRGYVVFEPDIPYKIGYPGESAYNAVIPGITYLINRGFIDEANIGVQGHSWGGYQIAYLITRTHIFKAAEAGAPVSNMVSAYGGIRWRTGISRMFQYERTQSRIGGSLWEYPMRYFENSPIFRADQIETPLLILHNDQDGAVPWYQGIELFVALRRLNKPVWLINYNNEPHWPVKYQNKRDWQIRLQQYFDHYLKDAPAPIWLQEGVPAIQKGKTLGLEAEE